MNFNISDLTKVKVLVMISEVCLQVRDFHLGAGMRTRNFESAATCNYYFSHGEVAPLNCCTSNTHRSFGINKCTEINFLARQATSLINKGNRLADIAKKILVGFHVSWALVLLNKTRGLRS